MAEGETRGAYWKDSTSPTARRPGFWFLRPFRRMGLSDWEGVLVLTAAAFGGVTVIDWVAVGSLGTLGTLYLPFHLACFSLAAILLGREFERILDYAESLGAGGVETMRATLYNTGWALLIALPLEAAYLVSVLMAPAFTLSDVFRNADLLGIFHVLVAASAVWTFVYSMRALHRLGHAPLTLKPFTEDRSLGLRPFGVAALRLVAIYEVAVLIGAIPMIVGSEDNPAAAPTFAVLALAGAVLFFLPLSSFRRQMCEAKARELRWIGPRYGALVKAVREGRGSYVDAEIVGSLSALEQIQRDVQQIHTWPLDEAMMVRLVSITVMPMVVAVLARELMILVLHV